MGNLTSFRDDDAKHGDGVLDIPNNVVENLFQHVDLAARCGLAC